MRLLTLLVLTIALAFTGCSNEGSNDSGVNSVSLASSAEADVTLKGDGEYKKVIISPLFKLDDCKYIVQGTIEYRLNGEVVAIVDYGNGECDNIATKTVDGETTEFELDGDKDDDKGKEYEKVITNPLVRLEDCGYIVEGTIEYYENSVWVATVDYGDGECDEWATKTWDGGSKRFSLAGGK